MSKSIELTESQIKALENSATMLIFPCKHEIISSDKERTVFKAGEWQHNIPTELYIKDFAPLQKGDKDVWVKEECFFIEQTKEHIYKSMFSNNKITLNETYDIEDFNWQPASQMTKEQSRYSIDCLDVKLVKVQDMIINDCIKVLWLKGTLCNGEFELANLVAKEFKNHYNKQMQEQNIKRTYEDNNYIFLVEIKLNKKDTDV